jgi:hypothetical protein
VEYSFNHLKNAFLNNPSQNNAMARIQDYVVITSSKGIENLESLIKENIRLGWQPLGGVAAVNSVTQTESQVSNEVTYAQAMVLYND